MLPPVNQNPRLVGRGSLLACLESAMMSRLHSDTLTRLWRIGRGCKSRCSQMLHVRLNTLKLHACCQQIKWRSQRESNSIARRSSRLMRPELPVAATSARASVVLPLPGRPDSMVNFMGFLVFLRDASNSQRNALFTPHRDSIACTPSQVPMFLVRDACAPNRCTQTLSCLQDVCKQNLHRPDRRLERRSEFSTIATRCLFARFAPYFFFVRR